MAHAQFRHAPLDGRGRAAADDGNVDAGVDYPSNAVTVLGVERLGLDAVIGQVETGRQ